MPLPSTLVCLCGRYALNVLWYLYSCCLPKHCHLVCANIFPLLIENVLLFSFLHADWESKKSSYNSHGIYTSVVKHWPYFYIHAHRRKRAFCQSHIVCSKWYSESGPWRCSCTFGIQLHLSCSINEVLFFYSLVFPQIWYYEAHAWISPTLMQTTGLAPICCLLLPSQLHHTGSNILGEHSKLE